MKISNEEKRVFPPIFTKDPPAFYDPSPQALMSTDLNM
jgi:hypothetical protein